MSKATQISNNLWMLNLGVVNAYLLKSAGELVLIDTGWPNKVGVLFAAIRETGEDPMKIRHVVLTHGHIDHAGGAADVIAQTGAVSYAHAGDRDLITEGHAEHRGTTITPGLMPALVHFFFIRPGGTKFKPFKIDHFLEDGQGLAMAPDVKVIHSPGHSAGHVALLMRQQGILIAADICSNVMGLHYSVINEDRALARQSILRVAEHSFERAVFGHGKPVNAQANKLLRKSFEALIPS